MLAEYSDRLVSGTCIAFSKFSAGTTGGRGADAALALSPAPALAPFRALALGGFGTTGVAVAVIAAPFPLLLFAVPPAAPLKSRGLIVPMVPLWLSDSELSA